MLLVALGYFVYDTIACALIEEDRANAAHHVCSIAAVAVGIFGLHVRPLMPAMLARAHISGSLIPMVCVCRAGQSWCPACS